MALLESKVFMSAPNDVFEAGKYEVTTITVKASDPSKPPTELFIVAPLTKGTFPVLLFCHGFELNNTWYTTLLKHIASHGYIVVAPKFYGIISISIPEEVKKASKVSGWFSTGLPGVLPDNVLCDMSNVALSGHSRGGKVAFALAQGQIDQKPKSSILAKIVFLLSFGQIWRKKILDDTPLMLPKFKALIGIDPVAGTAPSNRPAPKILEYIPRCFDMSTPVAVIGTGYGNQSAGIVPPFAPDGVNHSEFFNESKPPAAYFLAKEYGHCDMLDEWIASKLSVIAKSGKGPRGPMRKCVGGIVVAFLKAYLGGNEDDFNAIVNEPKIAPIILDPVIFVKK